MSPERHDDADVRGKEKATDVDDIPYFLAGNIDDEDDEVYRGKEALICELIVHFSVDGADEDFEDDDFDEDAFSLDEEDECDDDEEGMELVDENPFEEEQGALLDFGDNPGTTPCTYITVDHMHVLIDLDCNLEPLSLKDILPPGSKRRSRPDFVPASEINRQHI